VRRKGDNQNKRWLRREKGYLTQRRTQHIEHLKNAVRLLRKWDAMQKGGAVGVKFVMDPETGKIARGGRPICIFNKAKLSADERELSVDAFIALNSFDDYKTMTKVKKTVAQKVAKSAEPEPEPEEDAEAETLEEQQAEPEKPDDGQEQEIAEISTARLTEELAIAPFLSRINARDKGKPAKEAEDLLRQLLHLILALDGMPEISLRMAKLSEQPKEASAAETRRSYRLADEPAAGRHRQKEGRIEKPYGT
jgi:hypothetical protein